MQYELNPDPPFTVQIELTEGCPLYCDFCGLQGIRTKKDKNYKHASFQTINTLAKQIATAGWNPRIELAMHGEPTAHPKFLLRVKQIRSRLPKASIMLTTNGYGFLKSPRVQIAATLDAGVNAIALDQYEYVNWYKKILQDLAFGDYDFQVGNYPADKNLSPHQRWKPTARQLILMQDISKATDGTHSNLTNHSGCAFPLDFTKSDKRCAKPFREISVRWDGSIAVCCEDWRGYYPCGNIHNTPIDQIWAGPAFRTVRRYLYHKQRPMTPCRGCNATGYRLGLLPDKKGKAELPEPTSADKLLWKKTLKKGPLTSPILRDWEK